MVSQNYILIGLQSFIGRLMEYLHVMVFCLITRVQEEAKPLLQEK